MKASKGICHYILGAWLQLGTVCLIMYILEKCNVQYPQSIKLLFLAIGGTSSALWGIIIAKKTGKIKNIGVVFGQQLISRRFVEDVSLSSRQPSEYRTYQLFIRFIKFMFYLSSNLRGKWELVALRAISLFIEYFFSNITSSGNISNSDHYNDYYRYSDHCG